MTWPFIHHEGSASMSGPRHRRHGAGGAGQAGPHEAGNHSPAANRYVDGLATVAPDDPAAYAAGTQRLVTQGYLPPPAGPGRED